MAKKQTGEALAVLAKYEKELNSFKDTMAEAKSLGNTLTTGGVMVRMMALAVRDGQIAVKNKMGAHDFAPTFDGFASGWYGKGKGGKREKPPTAKSRKTLIGGYQPFVDAVIQWGEKGSKPVLDALMDMKATPIGTIGAKLKALMEDDDWAETPPDQAAINKAAGIGKKRRRGGKTKYNGKGVVRGLCSRGELIAKKADFITWAQSKPTYGVLIRDYLEAVAALRERLREDEVADSANRPKYEKLVKVSTAAAGKLPRAASASKRAN